MSRVTTANKCFDRHELAIQGETRTFFCQRARGHRGYHHDGGIEWGTLTGREDLRPAPPPAPGSRDSGPLKE